MALSVPQPGATLLDSVPVSERKTWWWSGVGWSA